MNIAPKHGFDWSKVTWSAPDGHPPVTCCYCGARLPVDEEGYETGVPLMLFRDNGACIKFCDQCMVEWWGFDRRPLGGGEE